MGPSRGAGALVACVLALVCAGIACDTLLGLGGYTVGDDVDGGTPGGGGGVDASLDADAQNAATRDASFDAGRDGGGEAMAEGVDFDATPDVTTPTALQIWAQWPMPNPEASIAPGSDASLPNPMTYAVADASGDGASEVYDEVTGLAWEPGLGAAAGDYATAWEHCEALASVILAPAPTPWRVPARIELVSLLDFTRQPMIDMEAFGIAPGTAVGTYWSSSVVPDNTNADASLLHWTVDFTAGGVSPTGLGQSVRCVYGGAP